MTDEEQTTSDSSEDEVDILSWKEIGILNQLLVIGTLLLGIPWSIILVTLWYFTTAEWSMECEIKFDRNLRWAFAYGFVFGVVGWAAYCTWCYAARWVKETDKKWMDARR